MAPVGNPLKVLLSETDKSIESKRLRNGHKLVHSKYFYTALKPSNQDDCHNLTKFIMGSYVKYTFDRQILRIFMFFIEIQENFARSWD